MTFTRNEAAFRPILAVAAVSCCGAFAGAQAPSDGAASEPSRLTFSLDARSEFGFEADIDDSEGSVSTTRVGADLGLRYRATDKIGLGLKFGAEYSFYDFDDFETVAGLGDPFDDGAMYSLTPTISFSPNDDWRFIGGAILRWSVEEGADLGDGFTGGGLFAANRRVNDRLTLGFGFIVGSRLEDDPIFIPALTIDWQINDRWSLSNEEKPGLAIRYKAMERLTLAAEAWYTTRDYRLDADNAIPGGAMEDTRVPVAFSARWRAMDNLTLIGRVGAFVYNEYEFRNDDGDEVTDADVDPSLFIGVEGRLTF